MAVRKGGAVVAPGKTRIRNFKSSSRDSYDNDQHPTFGREARSAAISGGPRRLVPGGVPPPPVEELLESSLEQVLELHRLVLEQSGGSDGVRDLGALDSALAQPRMTFGGQDLYPSLAEKAAALGFSLVCNHPFVDGNKRVGHAAMETFLVLNGWEIHAEVAEQEQVILQLAAGQPKREAFVHRVVAHLRERTV
jgi:death-on-curing protein